MFFNEPKKNGRVLAVILLWIFLLIQNFSCIHNTKSAKPNVDEPKVFYIEGCEPGIGNFTPIIVAPTIQNIIVDTLCCKAEGHIVLLNFWSLRCGPCIKEMPYLEKLYQEFKDNGLKVFSINTDQATKAEIDKFVAGRDFEINYDVITDPDLVLSSVFTSWFVPVTILIDSKGIMRYNNTGFARRDYEKYRKIIKSLIKEQI
jgi:thiol-disulfide isomerase/thioredoxin